MGWGRDKDSTAVGGRNLATAFLPAPLGASLRIGCMASWTQSHLEVWRLHLLNRPHRALKDEGLEKPFPLTALAAPTAPMR